MLLLKRFEWSSFFMMNALKSAVKIVAGVASFRLDCKTFNLISWLINLSFKLTIVPARRFIYNFSKDILLATSKIKAKAIILRARAFTIISAPFRDTTISKIVFIVIPTLGLPPKYTPP